MVAFFCILPLTVSMGIWGAEEAWAHECNQFKKQSKGKKKTQTGLVHNLRCIYAIRRHQNLLVQVTTEKKKYQLVKTLPEAEVSKSVPGVVHAWATPFNYTITPEIPRGWYGSVLSSVWARCSTTCLCANYYLRCRMCSSRSHAFIITAQHPLPRGRYYTVEPDASVTWATKASKYAYCSTGCSALLNFPKLLFSRHEPPVTV